MTGLNALRGKTVATADLELEEDSSRRYIAVLTFTDGSWVTFEGDIDQGVEYSTCIVGPLDP
jgi:hypothetical protein